MALVLVLDKHQYTQHADGDCPDVAPVLVGRITVAAAQLEVRSGRRDRGRARGVVMFILGREEEEYASFVVGKLTREGNEDR